MAVALGHRARCYIASPLGFTEAGRSYYADVYLPALEAVVQVVDPWSLTTPAEIEEARATGRQREMALTIGRRNIEAIRSADLLAAYLDGQEPDSGTVAELGYAAGIGKLCFGLRSDFRQAGEEGALLNLQVQTFIVETGGCIAESLAELATHLEQASQELLLAPAQSR